MATDIETAESNPEDLEAFRLRARQWLAENMPLLNGRNNGQLMAQDEMGTRARELQGILYRGGFAGICFPVEYGGLGLSRAYQVAFTQESAPYEMPVVFNIPTFSILAPTLLDFGTEEHKRRHIPKMLSGEELWVQFLSEPSGGSDLASLVTRATRDGDVFILNGSKIWSSGAFRADYALCLARTEWHVPKHRGLTCFIVKIHQPGIEVQQIKMVNGTNEFCQEFFDDVAIPLENVVGEVNDGWTVATRLLYHERDAVGGGSPYISGLSGSRGDHGTSRGDLIELARSVGRAKDPRVRQLVAEARANDLVGQQLINRVSQGISSGTFPGVAGSVFRLFAATNTERHQDIALEIAGAGAGVWEEGDLVGEKGIEYLTRQSGSLGGGSNEMQRNIISERVLGMPREFAADKDKPFDEVRHNSSPSRAS
jgi:alkylation response protein AidB-like acyl-CoA dehydrogenase